MESSEVSVLWTKLAAEVGRLIKSANVKEIFRQRVREAAGEWLRVRDEKEKRERARREAFSKNGVLIGHQKLPEQPSRTYIYAGGPVRGRVNLPDELKSRELCQSDKKSVRKEKVLEHIKKFEYIKSRGFPNDADGNTSYSYAVECWIPSELSADLDPDDSLPLPVPGRPVSLGDKYAALAAVHNTHWKVAEDTVELLPGDAVDVEAHEAAKVARKEAAEQDAEKVAAEADRSVRRMSCLYLALVTNAKQLDEDTDPSYLKSWLDDVKADLGVGAAASLQNRRQPTRKPGGQQKHDTGADKRLADQWEIAKRNGAYKPDFARNNDLSQKDFDRLLNRVRKAKS